MKGVEAGDGVVQAKEEGQGFVLSFAKRDAKGVAQFKGHISQMDFMGVFKIFDDQKDAGTGDGDK